MKTKQQAGVFIDHSSAHIMVVSGSSLNSTRIESSFTAEKKQSTLAKNENLMHQKEQHEQSGYYKKIAKALSNLDEVLLFGPTDAKRELANLLKADHRYSKIKIDLKESDKLSENQQHAFVKTYFKIE
jgi:stalled ribosome rescue protein Dom34